MSTLILCSGGWRSLSLLSRWLRFNHGHVAVLHCRLGDGRDNDRDRGYSSVRAHIESQYPGRVSWYDSAFSHVYKAKANAAESLRFQVDQFRKLSGIDVKKILVPVACGLGKQETVNEQSTVEALASIPAEIMRHLATCDHGLLPCGKCPACQELAAARAQMMDG